MWGMFIASYHVSMFYTYRPLLRLLYRMLVFSLILYYYIRVRIFKNKWFHRFANKEGITDSELKEVVKQLENGQFYADLGGNQLTAPREAAFFE